MSKGKRMSISLSGDSAAMLDELATGQGISINEALRLAIATEAYFYKAKADGAKVLIQTPEGEIKEVIFR